MSTTTPATQIIGKFVWHELAVGEVQQAKVFYGSLFNWTFKDVSDAHMAYHLVLKDGKDIGGIWPIDADHAGKVPPHWGCYVSVADVDATVALARENGANVVVEPMDIGPAGRMSVLQDPTGAHITVYRDSGADRPDVMPETGEFCWDDLETTDLEAAKAFYAKIFGWKAEAMGPPEDPMTVFQRADGQMVASAMKAQPGVPSHWATYVAVDDLAASRARAEELGAKIVVAEIPVPGIGRFAIVADPVGAYIRLFQSDRT